MFFNVVESQFLRQLENIGFEIGSLCYKLWLQASLVAVFFKAPIQLLFRTVLLCFRFLLANDV